MWSLCLLSGSDSFGLMEPASHSVFALYHMAVDCCDDCSPATLLADLPAPSVTGCGTEGGHQAVGVCEVPLYRGRKGQYIYNDLVRD